MTLDGRKEEADLLSKAAKGDQGAFGEIVSRYMGRSFSLAFRLLRQREDAEDAVQESFQKVWRHAHRYDQKRAQLSTWIFTIVTRTCLDRLRRPKWNTHPIEDFHEQLVDQALNPAQSLEKADQASGLKQSIDRLSVKSRAAIILCYYEGLTNAEAAKVLGVGLKAFESQLLRARNHLKQDLDRNYDETL